MAFNDALLVFLDDNSWARFHNMWNDREAYRTLNGVAYADMGGNRRSPLHVKLVVSNGRVAGYAHRGQLHAKNAGWILDLVKTRASKVVRREKGRLLLRKGVDRAQGFRRDVCAI